MKEYMKRDSQRSEGCFAFDGGQTWPLGAVAIVFEAEEKVSQVLMEVKSRECYFMSRAI